MEMKISDFLSTVVPAMKNAQIEHGDIMVTSGASAITDFFVLDAIGDFPATFEIVGG